MKPAQSPSPKRMYSVNEPKPGVAAAISLSMRITTSTTAPASA